MKDWLSLGEAAQLLGVHPSTVRQWSNLGALPVHRTKGGHRRYQRSEIEIWMQSQRTNTPVDHDKVVRSMLNSMRFQISEGCLEEEIWYRKLDKEARLEYRNSSRTLLQGLICYLNSEDERAVAEADAVGYEYGLVGRRNNLSSVESTQAMLFFRNMLIDAMLSVYEGASICSPNAWGEMFRKVNHFTDRILIKILQTYEIYRKRE
jgi:excisionase family DNA binding protein